MPMYQYTPEEMIAHAREFLLDENFGDFKERLLHVMFNTIVFFAVQDDVFEAIGNVITADIVREATRIYEKDGLVSAVDYVMYYFEPFAYYVECETRGEIYEEALKVFEKYKCDVETLQRLVNENHPIFQREFFPELLKLMKHIPKKITD